MYLCIRDVIRPWVPYGQVAGAGPGPAFPGPGLLTLDDIMAGARSDAEFQSRLRVMDIDEVRRSRSGGAVSPW